MREYKGYKIQKVTARDWLVRDADGNVVKSDRLPRTLKEAKEFIDSQRSREAIVRVLRSEVARKQEAWEMVEDGYGGDIEAYIADYIGDYEAEEHDDHWIVTRIGYDEHWTVRK